MILTLPVAALGGMVEVEVVFTAVMVRIRFRLLLVRLSFFHDKENMNVNSFHWEEKIYSR
jgi:hypothetical protein